MTLRFEQTWYFPCEAIVGVGRRGCWKVLPDVGVALEGVTSITPLFFDRNKVILELVLNKLLIVEDLPQVLLGVVIELGEAAVP
jgi:hypothetical protein